MNEKKILIVDDDRHLVLGLSARLKASGYKVVSAGDAISAPKLLASPATPGSLLPTEGCITKGTAFSGFPAAS